jgi:hypothetical protein
MFVFTPLSSYFLSFRGLFDLTLFMSTSFAQKNAFNGYQDNSFLPPRFWSVINEDLNGMFGLYHHDDDFANSGDASYGVYSTHSSLLLVLGLYPNTLC